MRQRMDGFILSRIGLTKSTPVKCEVAHMSHPSWARDLSPCLCLCLCVFIKLHITAQSGPVILVILCHLHWSSQGGINDTCYENLWSGATEGTHSLYLYNSYLSPEYLVLPPPASLLLSRLCGLTATEPCVCVCVFIKLHITAQCVFVCVCVWVGVFVFVQLVYVCVCVCVCIY